MDSSIHCLLQDNSESFFRSSQVDHQRKYKPLYASTIGVQQTKAPSRESAILLPVKEKCDCCSAKKTVDFALSRQTVQHVGHSFVLHHSQWTNHRPCNQAKPLCQCRHPGEIESLALHQP